MAARVRFELTVLFRHDSFQDCFLKPLGHLAIMNYALILPELFFEKRLIIMVEVTGFELATLASQTRCSSQTELHLVMKNE